MRNYLMLLVLCLVLAACGASAVARHGQAYTQPSASPAAGAAAFAKAQAAWKRSASVAAADVSHYLLQSAGDLKAAGGNGYAAAEKALTTLASMPETGATGTQQAEARSDVAALDGFFSTPGMTPNG